MTLEDLGDEIELSLQVHSKIQGMDFLLYPRGRIMAPSFLSSWNLDKLSGSLLCFLSRDGGGEGQGCEKRKA